MIASAARRPPVLAAIALICSVLAPGAQASHSWNGYHWATNGNGFNLKLGDNVSRGWESILDTAAADWSVSGALDTHVVAGTAGNVRKCPAQTGRVEICNTTYGNNGWLGVAQIWISGAHITKGTVKVNDTYFNTASYNTPAWRNLVLCQEIGHTFGLDHQDEVFNNPNLDTCMDYTSDPATNQHPNKHDYDELVLIYNHADSTITVDQSARTAPASEPDVSESSQWGRLVKQSRDGRHAKYARDLGGGRQVHTFVFWAEPSGGRKN